MARRSGVRFLGNRVSYRNAYARAAVEEVRGLLAAASESFSLGVKKELEQACQEFVDYYGSDQIFPIKTGNLIDSFGVGIYKGDALFNLYTLPARATQTVRTGFTALNPIDQVITRWGSVRDIISGRIELDAMSTSANISPHKLNKAGLTTKNTVTAIMYIAAPYARTVHEKGFPFGEGPINRYYEVLEYNFEHDLLKRLQDVYEPASGMTKYRERYHLPKARFTVY